jgi:hypothetical protein
MRALQRVVVLAQATPQTVTSTVVHHGALVCSREVTAFGTFGSLAGSFRYYHCCGRFRRWMWRLLTSLLKPQGFG